LTLAAAVATLRRMLRTAAPAIALTLVAAAPAAAAPSIDVAPRVVDRDETQVVKGRGWPVFESCEREVVILLKSDQNRVRLDDVRVRRSGRFRFEWNAVEENVGSGRWRLVARMECESGDDGSAIFIRRRAAIRVRR
jgi:hypothetical protein